MEIRIPFGWFIAFIQFHSLPVAWTLLIHPFTLYKYLQPITSFANYLCQLVFGTLALQWSILFWWSWSGNDQNNWWYQLTTLQLCAYLTGIWMKKWGPGFDLVLIKTSVLFICKFQLPISMRTASFQEIWNSVNVPWSRVAQRMLSAQLLPIM